ncbi:MAG: DUF1648 domain-containing protein [Phycisphaerales bacterium]
MTEEGLSLLVAIGQIALLGGLMFLIPSATRRGLLFGVYVGEDRSDAVEARALVRRWRIWMSGVVFAAAAIAVLAEFILPEGWSLGLSVIGLVLGFFGSYLAAHFRARDFAAPNPGRVSTASLEPESGDQSILPVATLVIGGALAACSASYLAQNYDALPEQIPIHFDLSGTPDRWAGKSIWSVGFLPFMAFFLAALMSGVTWMVAHAKRVSRQEMTGVSVAAQDRFRRWMTWMTALIGVFTSGMFAVGAVSTVRVATGASERLSLLFMLLGAGLVILPIALVAFAALRIGQGGGRLEAAASEAPLDAALADNSKWRLGLIYLNPDDPAMFIEHRFGIGYTINFGNWKAVALLLGFVGFSVGVSLLAALLT